VRVSDRKDEISNGEWKGNREKCKGDGKGWKKGQGRRGNGQEEKGKKVRK